MTPLADLDGFRLKIISAIRKEIDDFPLDPKVETAIMAIDASEFGIQTDIRELAMAERLFENYMGKWAREPVPAGVDREKVMSNAAECSHAAAKIFYEAMK